MTLTQENYYGPEANKAYMSKSQFGRWAKCEAATRAEIMGEWEPERNNEALLVGNFVDSALDSPEEHAKWLAEHPEVINSRSKTKELKAVFQKAQEMVERVKQDRLMMMLLEGEKQKILHGTIAGVPFRGKCDVVLSPEQCKRIMAEFPETVDVLGSIFTEGAIVDLKTTKDFGLVWSDADGRKISWIENYGYVYQAAIYRELYRQMYGVTLPFVIAAVSKEDGNGISALYIPHEEMDAALRVVEENAPIYQEVKEGKREPIRCENCAYCRATKKLTGILNYKEV